jgi:glycogen debranching enzyme
MRGGKMAALREVPFAHYYGSVDATPLFVLLAGLYVERTPASGELEPLTAESTRPIASTVTSAGI